MGQAASYNNEIQKDEQQREYKSEREKYNKYFENKGKSKHNPADRLYALSKRGFLNSFYKRQKKRLLDTNDPTSAQQVLNELKRRLNEKYTGWEEGKRKARKEFLDETINLLIPQAQQAQQAQTAGSKKRRRRQKVKGKRVLKNGTLAGYVKQADGSWRWRFLPK